MAIEDLITALPKVELHVHLEGSMPPELLLRLGQKHGLSELPQSPEELARWYEFRDFAHFIDVNNLRRVPDGVAGQIPNRAAAGAAYEEINRFGLMFARTYFHKLPWEGQRDVLVLSYGDLFHSLCKFLYCAESFYRAKGFRGAVLIRVSLHNVAGERMTPSMKFEALAVLAAVALAAFLYDRLDEDGLPITLAGPGLRDTLRLAGSPYSTWRDIVLTNRELLSASLDLFARRLDDLRERLASRDLEGDFESANCRSASRAASLSCTSDSYLSDHA